jgi:uncharacterized membrane protein
MRLIPILVLTLVLALAGCAKKDDGGTATSTPPTGSTTTKTTTTTATTTPTGTTTPTNTTPTTPTKPAPQELAKGAADFSNPTGPTGVPKTFTIPAGYTMGNLTVVWTCTGGLAACVTNAVSLKAAGLVCSLPAGPLDPTAATSKCSKSGAVTAGDGKVEAGDMGPGAVSGAFTFTVT